MKKLRVTRSVNLLPYRKFIKTTNIKKSHAFNILSGVRRFILRINVITGKGRIWKNILEKGVTAFSLFFMSSLYSEEIKFQEHNIYIDNPGWWSQQAYAADIDGDGYLDAISCSRFGSGRVRWFESKGGSIPTFITHVIDYNPDCRAVFAADLDGDGDTDILSASALAGAREVRWYENDGGSSPRFKTHTVPTTAIDFFAVWADDLDGDGDTDLITGSGPSGASNNQVAWHENKGGIPPIFVEHELSRNTDWPHSIRSADLDGDNDIDIAVGSLGDGKIVWYENGMYFPKEEPNEPRIDFL